MESLLSMMRTFLIILTCLLISSCRTSLDLSQDEEDNPCTDHRYLILKKINVSKMTKAEVEYFKYKERQCNAYLKEEKKQATTNFIIILSSIAAVTITLAILFSGKWH